MQRERANLEAGGGDVTKARRVNYLDINKTLNSFSVEAEKPAPRPTSNPQRVFKLHLTGLADLRGGRSGWWGVGEVERVTLRCDVVTVQSQVVRKVAAKEEEEEEEEGGGVCSERGVLLSGGGVGGGADGLPVPFGPHDFILKRPEEKKRERVIVFIPDSSSSSSSSSLRKNSEFPSHSPSGSRLYPRRT